MALLCTAIFAMLVVYCSSQMMPIPGYFNVPATAFNSGGRVNFAGASLSQVCKQILMMGGKEALSDGMGAAAKWFASQKIGANVAGGNDPQMQCLYQQATGSMMPGMVGQRDPGNMFGDYFDTVIEYPMIVNPCDRPQCNGQVNPTVLLMQAYAPMMRGMGGMGGMGGGMGGMGGYPAMGGNSANPFSTMMSQNPLMTMLTGMTGSPMNTKPVSTATPPPQQPKGGLPADFAKMMQMLQNPQVQQMLKQMMGGLPGSGPTPLMPF